MQQDVNTNTAKNNPDNYSPIAKLVQLGREKSYVTLDDILKYFPKPEKNLEELDRVFAALLSADITYYSKTDNKD